MIAPGSARFFPATSSALPCATEENSTGVPSVSAAVPEKACVFAMMCPWSWIMTTKASKPAFARVRIESRNGDARVGDADAPQRRIRRADRVHDAVARDELDRAAQACVQCGVGDAHFGPVTVEAEHEKHVLGWNAGAARDEGRIAVELDSRELDRAFGLWRSDHCVDLACERGVDRRLRGAERGFAVRCRDRADVQLAGLELPTLDQGQRAVAPGRIRGARHAAEIRFETAGFGMRLERAAVAEEQRPADFSHLEVQRGLERDLGADSRRVAGGDGDSRQRHQSAFTPAERITSRQRSVSFFMNAAICAGVLPITSAERSARRLRTSGSFSTSATAAEIFSAIGIGVFGGATMPNQATASNPGRISASAGTSGSDATRFSLHTASSFSLPLTTCCRDTPRLSNIISTCPASRSVSAGALPL